MSTPLVTKTPTPRPGDVWIDGTYAVRIITAAQRLNDDGQFAGDVVVLDEGGRTANVVSLTYFQRTFKPVWTPGRGGAVLD